MTGKPAGAKRKVDRARQVSATPRRAVTSGDRLRQCGRRSTMQFLFRFLGMKPRLDRWEGRVFSARVEHGPGPRDNQDAYEREVAVEVPGEPGGPFRRIADAILRYDIFPPSFVTPILRRATL